jgi:predicted nuclease of predicted toxin-antitoxin system
VTLRLYMDHHVPTAITEALRQRGVDVLTAEEDDTATLADDPLLDRATALGRFLFSQDRDLLVIAHRRQQAGPEFGGIIYGHQLGISISQAVRDLELAGKVLDPDDMRKRIDYLPYD